MKWFFLLFIVMLIFSCQNDKIEEPLLFPELMEIPEHFPNVEFPDGTEFTLDRWKLGKKLFYDNVMSIDSSISCASCHKQELGFSDDIAFSLGVEDRLGTRNECTYFGKCCIPPLFHKGRRGSIFGNAGVCSHTGTQ